MRECPEDEERRRSGIASAVGVEGVVQERSAGGCVAGDRWTNMSKEVWLSLPLEQVALSGGD